MTDLTVQKQVNQTLIAHALQSEALLPSSWKAGDFLPEQVTEKRLKIALNDLDQCLKPCRVEDVSVLLARLWCEVPEPSEDAAALWIEKLAGRYPAWVVADACEALIETHRYPTPARYADLKAQIDGNKRYQRFATQRSNVIRALSQLRKQDEGARRKPIKPHIPQFQQIEPEPKGPTPAEYAEMQRRVVAECEAAGLYPQNEAAE